jgi:hypothetical protein
MLKMVGTSGQLSLGCRRMSARIQLAIIFEADPRALATSDDTKRLLGAMPDVGEDADFSAHATWAGRGRNGIPDRHQCPV